MGRIWQQVPRDPVGLCEDGSPKMSAPEAPAGFHPPINRDLDERATAVPAESLC